jgi:16S rRNA (guanine527-N7)-methyltransferase
MTIQRDAALSFGAIQTAIIPFGVQVTPHQADQIQHYVSLLLKWNQVVSLTSVTARHEIISRHFGESFYAASFVDLAHGRLADVGSGAGFPGLALKILQPELEITLIESNGRKCSFLKEIARSLDLHGVSVAQQRLEHLDDASQRFDFICARALGQFKGLLQWAKPSLSPDGKLLLWLGQEDATVLSAQRDWDWGDPLRVPGSDHRVLLIGRLIQR